MSDSIVRARYLENLQQGLSDDTALDEADAFTASVMADRSKGALPTIFTEKNPVTKLLTMFQVEQAGQFDYYFKDIPRYAPKEKVAAANFFVAALIKALVGMWLINEWYEDLIGRRPATDLVGMVQDIFEDIANGKDTYEVVSGAIGDVLEQVPFIGGLMGGGRLPISSALPDFEAIGKAALQKEDDPDTEEIEGVTREQKWGDVFEELRPTLLYTLPPFGGGQAKKIIETLEAVKGHGSYSASGALQYPVFTDDPADAAVTYSKGLIFGKSSLDEAVEWVESDFKGLSERYTEAYTALLEQGENDRAAYETVKAVSDAKKTETESAETIKRRVLQEQDVSDETKLTVYCAVLASDRELELIDALGEEETGEIYELVNRLYGSDKAGEKRTVIQTSGMTDAGKETVWKWLKGNDQEDQEKADERLALANDNGLGIDEVIEMENAGANFEQFEKLTDAGVSGDTAYTVTMAMREAEDANGEEELGTVEKWRIIIDNAGSERERMSALSVVMSETQYARLANGSSYVTAEDYVEFWEKFRKEYPEESMSQERAETVLDGMSVSNSMKAALWQIATNGKDGKKNPYDTRIGAELYYDPDEDTGLDWAGR